MEKLVRPARLAFLVLIVAALIAVALVTLYKLQIVDGKAYYEENRGTADGLFAQLCAEIDDVNGRIEALKAEIEKLRGQGVEAPDFESVVAADEGEPDIEVEITQE